MGVGYRVAPLWDDFRKFYCFPWKFNYFEGFLRLNGLLDAKEKFYEEQAHMRFQVGATYQNRIEFLWKGATYYMVRFVGFHYYIVREIFGGL